MQRAFSILLLAGPILAGIVEVAALESAPVERPGIRSVRLVTDVSAIVPGEPITVALRLVPQPGHHTYWRGPGIVGVATRLDWTLPEGFSAGEILWPPPSQVLMAGIVAQGYKHEVLLLVEIATPAEIDAPEVVLAARASWMACAVSCNPGIADLSLNLPVARPGARPHRDEVVTEAFAKAREALPKQAPAGWSFRPRLAAPDRIEVDLAIPGFDPAAAPSIRFYCDDMQVDSDEDQRVVVKDAGSGALRLILARPEFAPKRPASLSGVISCPAGWPGIGSSYVEFHAPWPEGTFPDE